MSFLENIISKFDEYKTEGDDLCNKVDMFLNRLDDSFSLTDTYINVEFSNEVKNSCAAFETDMNNLRLGSVLLNSGLKKRKRILNDWENSIVGRITEHNDKVASYMITSARQIIGSIEGIQLDDQQMKCIIKPASSQLVIAGAGTGKTTTIIGKIKYLIKSKICDANEILVLSFTNASASEMHERIIKETGMEIAASTFHKLGLNIIKNVDGITPRISKTDLRKFIIQELEKNMNDTKYLDSLCKYFLFNSKYNKSEFDFASQKEYDDYLHINPPVTLNGERVKSYGEMDIANFLFRNGIKYQYENDYVIDTRTEDRYQYHPDFYLPNSGHYIEYFGINEKGEVPAYFSSQNGKTPSEEYQASMEWKRKLHKTNKTKLIECYSYEHSRGDLLLNLEAKLRAQGVKFKPLSAQEIWDRISDNNSQNPLNGISELFATIINLMKSNEYDIEKLKEICRKRLLGGRNLIILDLIAPIYMAYEDELQKNGEIDFNDMINKAAHMVMDGKYINSYKYVIVDEYQDISKSRYNLLKALRNSSFYNIFCVGDDWQSIYRFAGSDMDYILNFSKYWGATDYSKIENTYRFTESMIEISGNFVMQNPMQIKKSIRGLPSKYGFALGEIKGYTINNSIAYMVERVRELPQNSSVFFIGRYNFDIKILENYPQFKCKFDKETQRINIEFQGRRDLNIEFVTAHRSKGLQADYVFIINNTDRGMGFPSRIQDDPIVDCLLEGKEDYAFAEERRLFYVALTRSKIKTYIVVVNGNESCFVTELERLYENELKKERFTCPLCGGKLVKKSGPYGEFWGCSNFRTSGCRYIRNIKNKQE